MDDRYQHDLEAFNKLGFACSLSTDKEQASVMLKVYYLLPAFCATAHLLELQCLVCCLLDLAFDSCHSTYLSSLCYWLASY